MTKNSIVFWYIWLIAFIAVNFYLFALFVKKMNRRAMAEKIQKDISESCRAWRDKEWVISYLEKMEWAVLIDIVFSCMRRKGFRTEREKNRDYFFAEKGGVKYCVRIKRHCVTLDEINEFSDDCLMFRCEGIFIFIGKDDFDFTKVSDDNRVKFIGSENIFWLFTDGAPEF